MINFFEAQASARRSTFLLVALLCVAVVVLVVITNLLVLVVIAYVQSAIIVTSMEDLMTVFDWPLFVMISIAVSLIVATGSYYKISLLSSGGSAVAESLGGRIIPQGSVDPMHRKILNVVEEMAIASGSPVPSVYLLDEGSINAFAAGWSPGNAVIGVTRGAVSYLSRDELQGVIAHEFSHIFNGDMRLNIRLTGLLHGILLLGTIGYYLMRSVHYVRPSRGKERDNAVAVAFVLGLGLILIGYIGTFFGQCIKAIVSRQREYLADASAVQFTRNRDGISGALKKIGGLHIGARLLSPSAPEYSHAYFAPGVRSALSFLFATHPPLKQRIRRLDPAWRGEYVMPLPDQSLESRAPAVSAAQQQAKTTATAMGVGVAVTEALQVMNKIGQPGQQEINLAREILAQLPQALKLETQDPYGARALIYCLLLHKDASDQQQQWQLLHTRADPGVYEKTQQLSDVVAEHRTVYRLPLIELCFPALRALSLPQYHLFKDNLLALMAVDKKIDLGEWVIQRLLIQQLDEAHGLRKLPVAKYTHIGAVKREAEMFFSLVAYAEHKEDVDAAAAFRAGITAIGTTALKMLPRQAISLKALDVALDRLAQVKPLIKPRLLTAVAACIAVDDKITPAGEELLRTLSSCLDSPVPPILKN